MNTKTGRSDLKHLYVVLYLEHYYIFEDSYGFDDYVDIYEH